MQIISKVNSGNQSGVNKTNNLAKIKFSHSNHWEEFSGNVSKSYDAFEYNASTHEIGIYSPTSLLAKSEFLVSEIQSAAVYTSSSASRYNVVVNRAAAMAGVKVSANGTPVITGQYDYYNYQNSLSFIQGTFWCQTGGWSNLSGNGSKECARTASATMASINSGTVVTPNDTGSAMQSVTVNGTQYTRLNNYAHNYSTTNGAGSEFRCYGFGTEDELLDAINTELSNNRSVIVYVSTLSSGTEHWVTVTGTVDGKPAESFSDLMGVDPWYNGNNTANGGSTGTGNGACNASKSGVIALSTTCSGFRYDSNGYKIATFNLD